MVKLLSGLNDSIKFSTEPLVGITAGMQFKVAPGQPVPRGCLLCDGSAVSRTTYSDLFALIGTKYGAGDGSTTFNLPNGPRKSFDISLGSFAAFTASTVLSKGVIEQTADGDWFFYPTISGNTSVAANNVTLSFSGLGLSFDVTGSARQIISGSNNVSNGGNGIVNSATGIQLGAVTTGTTWGVSGKIKLTAAPTDAFVSQDSRYSTFDDALDGKPVIAAFTNSIDATAIPINAATAGAEGVVALNASYAAGNGVYGFVRANKSQTKILGSNITTANVDFLTFNNLVIGRRYEYKGNLGLAGSIAHVEIFENATAVKRIICNTTTGLQSAFYYEFTATETIIKCRTNPSWSGTVNATSGGLNCTWATLTEINNDILTTDFT